jgi:hypothetical protein
MFPRSEDIKHTNAEIEILTTVIDSCQPGRGKNHQSCSDAGIWRDFFVVADGIQQPFIKSSASHRRE